MTPLRGLTTGLAVIAACLLVGCGQPAQAETTDATVLAAYPHQRNAFTQGLVFDGEQLLESTGLYGESQLRFVDLESGVVQHAVDLPGDVFGEGLAVVDNRYIQLTWRENRAFVWSVQGRMITEFSYAGEGWGLAYDGADLIRSDGTDVLRWHATDDFRVLRSVHVTDGDTPIRRLNELEWVNGWLLANVFQSRRIAIIDPASGQVAGWMDLRGLDSDTDGRGSNVLNGIAWLASEQRLFVTGKRWGKLYDIRYPDWLLTPPHAAAD